MFLARSVALMCVESQDPENFITRVTQIYFSEPKGDKALEFRLLYWGQVLASSNAKRRSAEKHAMRRRFHPQLRRLWDTRKVLQWTAWNAGAGGEIVSREGEAVIPPTGSWATYGYEKMANENTLNGFRFVPLVTEKHVAHCAIEILFLRHEDTGNLIFQGGDIDGRVKTIFDALRIPKVGELAADDKPEEDEDPFFVLLEDDKLISRVDVSTEQLLLLPGERKISPNDAFLQIRVEIIPTAIPSAGHIFGAR
jgi:hypothetical protein